MSASPESRNSYYSFRVARKGEDGNYTGIPKSSLPRAVREKAEDLSRAFSLKKYVPDRIDVMIPYEVQDRKGRWCRTENFEGYIQRKH